MEAVPQSALRVCANCRVLVRPVGDAELTDPLLVWEHVPEFAAKFTRSVCTEPAPGDVPSGSELRFGLGRKRGGSKDKQVIRGSVAELLDLPEPAPGEPVVVAVDGSYKLEVTDRVRKPMSWAYLSVTGLYGLGTSIVSGRLVGGNAPSGDTGHQDPVRALQAELRAMANALKMFDSDTTVELLSDSRQALNMMMLWRDGHDVMPGGYDASQRAGGNESTLGRLARRVREHPDRVRLTWVPGHSGHPLNEGADALAKMARAWTVGRLDKETTAREAEQVALRALGMYLTTAVG